MSTVIDNKPEANKLYVGEGAVVKGTVLVADTVVVEGILEGDISAGNLHVSATGTIKGRISVAQNADIFGQLLEKLDVRGLLVLRSSSCVEGNVSCGMLTIEQGADITGGISSTNYQVAQQASKLDRKPDVQSEGGASTAKRPDLSALDLPSPIAANG